MNSSTEGIYITRSGRDPPSIMWIPSKVWCFSHFWLWSCIVCQK